MTCRHLRSVLFSGLCFTVIIIITRNGLAASDRLEEFREIIQKNNITSEKLSEYISMVTINDAKCEVYAYNPTDENDTLSNFMTCLQCEFGKWMVIELFRFLEPFQLVNHASFVHIHNNVYGLDYKESTKILNRISKQTERFINILLKFVNMNLNDWSIETGLLKSLLSLNLKIEFIKRLERTYHLRDDFDDDYVDEDREYYNGIYSDAKKGDTVKLRTDENDHDNDNFYDDDDDFYDDHFYDDDDDDDETIKGFDDIIVRLLTETINSIRGFMALNCKFSTPFFSIHQLNGYQWKQFGTDTLLTDEFLDAFSENPCCSVKKMLLLEARPQLWAGVKWKTPDGYVPVEGIVEKIGSCYSLEMVHWYQDMVFKTVMKIVLGSVDTCTADRLPENVVNQFDTFYRQQIVPDGLADGLPTDAIKIFVAFSEYNDDNHHLLLTMIDRYLVAIPEVLLEEDAWGPQNPEMVSDAMHWYGIRCFLRLYAFSRREYDRETHEPFARNPAEIRAFLRSADWVTETVDGFRPSAESSQTGDEDRFSADRMASIKDRFLLRQGCEVVRGLHQYCFAALNSLSGASTEFADNAKNYNTDATEYLNAVYDHLTALVSDDHWYRPHFRMAYRTVIALDLHVKRTALNPFNRENLARIAYATAAELNAHSLRYCTAPDNHLFFWQNIAFDALGRFVNVADGVSKAANLMGYNGSKDRKYSYQRFVNFSNISWLFKAVGQTILFNWRSGKKSIAYIYNHMESAVASPSVVYDFYDYFVKFSLAMIFYETEYLRCPREADVFDHGQLRIEEGVEWRQQIPEVYRSLADKIDMFVKTGTLNGTDGYIERPLSRQIRDRFKLIGVTVEAITEETNPPRPDLDWPRKRISKLYDCLQMIREADEYFKMQHGTPK